jgi:hypothetical protein
MFVRTILRSSWVLVVKNTFVVRRRLDFYIDLQERITWADLE